MVGNVGQADYAGANAYLDAFAHARQALVQVGQRQGVTLSINWPLWEAGGMQVEVETTQMMRKWLGAEPMGTEMGIVTLYQALASGLAQVLVFHGQVEHIKQQLLRRSPDLPLEDGRRGILTPLAMAAGLPRPLVPSIDPSIDPSMGQEDLWERASAYFKKQLAAIVKVPMQRIEASAPLEDYGFNSIMAIRFTNALEDSFGPLSKTLLFEYPTLHSITEYFLHSYPEQLRSVLGIEEAPATAIRQVTQEWIGVSHDPCQTASLPAGQAHGLYTGHPRSRLALLQKGVVGTGLAPVRFPTRPDKGAQVGDIAIIGLAGRYPGARDLRAFWENLRTGKDCITEIPPERWHHHLYFDADKDRPGTTYCKWGGFLDGVDEFDPLFFNISPREAERMDPQERLFLECVFATLEDAGYTREELSVYQGNGLAGNVGVFVGVMYEEYQLFGVE